MTSPGFASCPRFGIGAVESSPRSAAPPCANPKPSPRSAAPSRVAKRRRGETVARNAEGVVRVETRAGYKRKSGIKTPCHCETGAHTGRGNPHPLCTAQKRTSDSKRTDSHVASLLGMTVVFFTLPCLFPNGDFCILEHRGRERIV